MPKAGLPRLGSIGTAVVGLVFLGMVAAVLGGCGDDDDDDAQVGAESDEEITATEEATEEAVEGTTEEVTDEATEAPETPTPEPTPTARSLP